MLEKKIEVMDEEGVRAMGFVYKRATVCESSAPVKSLDPAPSRLLHGDRGAGVGALCCARAQDGTRRDWLTLQIVCCWSQRNDRENRRWSADEDGTVEVRVARRNVRLDREIDRGTVGHDGGHR